MRGLATLIAAAGSTCVIACGTSASAPSPISSAAAPVRVLLFSATAGFRHDSIDTARAALAARAAFSRAFTLTVSDDPAALEPARLAQMDVVFFAMTSGELPLTTTQRNGLIDFVRSGRGFIGTHSATDTLYGWPEYGALVGAYFKEHPWTQAATVNVEAAAHPTTAGLGASFQLREEFYTFRENPRPSVHVLLSLDAASVGASGDYPLAWTRITGAGRVYYNALGHFPETWNDPRFLDQIQAAIAWVAR
jgi:type 1 glutamine amidotransferase